MLCSRGVNPGCKRRRIRCEWAEACFLQTFSLMVISLGDSVGESIAVSVWAVVDGDDKEDAS